MLNAKIVLKDQTAPWVIFLHGFGGSGETWKKQIPAFQQSFNLLLINFHGGIVHQEILTVEGLCGRIDELLVKNGVERACVVSMSSSSMVALAYAALYPHRVQAMVLAGGILSFRIHTSFLLGCARALCDIVPYMLLYRFFAWVIMPGRNHKKSRSVFLREAVLLGHQEFCRWVRFMSLLQKNKLFIAAVNHYVPIIPFLYIMGEQDHLFLPAIKTDVSLLRDARVEILPGCGHVCSIEQVDLFNQTALRFLAGVLGTGVTTEAPAG